jgi:hypothetical protein
VKRYRLVVALLSNTALLLADGGTLVLRKRAGPFRITIFSSPQPLRVGPADLSVMVQQLTNESPVLDAKVSLHLTHSHTEGIREVYVPATHAEATNKLLYAARVNLPTAGSWQLAATVDSKNGGAKVAGELAVLPPQPPVIAYWPYFAVLPLIAILFAMNQWLKSERKITRPPAAP